MVLIHHIDPDGTIARTSERVLVSFDPLAEHTCLDTDYRTITKLRYADTQKDHREKYGPVEDRGEPAILQHPVDHPKELDQYVHLYTLLHLENRKKAEDLIITDENINLFDWAISDLCYEVLEIENLDWQKLGPGWYQLKTMVVMLARGYHPKTDGSEFGEYLKDESHGISNELGRKAPLGDLEMYKAYNKLSDSEFEALKRATKWAVYAVYREGIIPPKETQEKYNLDQIDHSDLRKDKDQITYLINRENMDRKHIREATRRWIRLLSKETLPPLTFGRAHKQYTIPEILGLYATATLNDCGLSAAASLGDWHYSPEKIAEPDYVKTIPGKYLTTDNGIEQKDDKEPPASKTPSVEQQFREIHGKTLQVAEKYDLFEGPQVLAIDDIAFNTGNKKSKDTINRPEHPIDAVKAQWKFTLLSIVTTESRFTIGAELITSEDERPEAAKNLLEIADEHIEIDRIYADAGMVSGDLIGHFRSYVGSDWFTKAPKHDAHIGKLPQLTPNNCVGYVEDVPWGTSPGNHPNLLAYPNPSKREAGKGTDDGTENQDNSNADKDGKPKLGKPIEFPFSLLKRDNVVDWLLGTSEAERKDPNQQSLEVANSTNNSKGQSIRKYPEDVPDLSSLRVTRSNSTHETYFMDKSFQDVDPDRLFDRYHQRWGIESTNDLLKNSFIPLSQSRLPEDRVFNMNLGILFQNWYTLINRVTSPELQHRLDPKPQEVLKAFQDVVWSEDIEIDDFEDSKYRNNQRTDLKHF